MDYWLTFDDGSVELLDLSKSEYKMFAHTVPDDKFEAALQYIGFLIYRKKVVKVDCKNPLGSV